MLLPVGTTDHGTNEHDRVGQMQNVLPTMLAEAGRTDTGTGPLVNIRHVRHLTATQVAVRWRTPFCHVRRRRCRAATKQRVSGWEVAPESGTVECARLQTHGLLSPSCSNRCRLPLPVD